MQCNLSKYSCTFSDFPWPEETPMFPTAEELLAHLTAYAKHFELEPHIRFGREVTLVSPNPEGLWEVTTTDRSESETSTFKYVVVCSGIFSSPWIPPSFRDSPLVSHSASFASTQTFRDKRVLVVGNAFSGAEIAAALAGISFYVTRGLNPRYLRKCLQCSGKLPLYHSALFRGGKNAHRPRVLQAIYKSR